MALALAPHIPRLRHQLGEKLRIGPHSYRVRGYFANRLSTTLEHEPHVMDVIRHAMSLHEGPVVDVGVNTGQTLLKILSIDPNRRYVGFEPQVGCCACVSQFLLDNQLQNARVIPMALSDRPGVIELHSSGGFDEMASRRARPGTQPFYAAAQTGDAALADLGLGNPGFIKIDVEGAEAEVMTGLRGTLTRARPTLLFEVLPNFVGEDRIPLPRDQAAKNAQSAARIFDLLTGMGYRIEQVHPSGDTVPVTAFNLDDRDGFLGRDFVAWSGVSHARSRPGRLANLRV